MSSVHEYSLFFGIWKALAGPGRSCQGGSGGGFTKARVCRKSSQEGKIRKRVTDERVLKNCARELAVSQVRRQNYSVMSATVWNAKASRLSVNRMAAKF